MPNNILITPLNPYMNIFTIKNLKNAKNKSLSPLCQDLEIKSNHYV